MTAITPDECENLGILAQFNAVFGPGPMPPEDEEEAFPACVDCGDELVGEGDRCSECAEEFERNEADEYRAIYREDSEPRICHNLYDGG